MEKAKGNHVYRADVITTELIVQTDLLSDGSKKAKLMINTQRS
jgi:hypothetical protein